MKKKRSVTTFAEMYFIFKYFLVFENPMHFIITNKWYIFDFNYCLVVIRRAKLFNPKM